MKYIILIAIISFCLSCEKPTIKEPISEIPLYEQIWETRFHPEKFVIHTNPHIYENLILTSEINSFDKRLDYNIGAYDKKTGEFLWGWSHPSSNTVILKTFGFGNLIFVKAVGSIFVFDIETKSILWEIEFSDDMSSIGSPVFIGDDFYLSTGSKVVGTSLKRSEMRIYNVLTGDFEVLYSEIENEIKPYKPLIRNITKFQNKIGVNNIVFEVAYIATEVSPRETLPDLVCMDLSTKEILWRKTDCNELASSYNKVKYHKGKLYNTGDWSLYAFDPKTGEELNRWQFWESHPLGSFNNTDFTIVDDVVYTLDDLGYLNGINTITEDFEFSYKRGAARSSILPIIRNDFIMYSSLGYQTIEIFDTKKQAFIHKEQYKSFGNNIVYDEETDMYFTTTSEMIHAFRIND